MTVFLKGPQAHPAKHFRCENMIGDAQCNSIVFDHYSYMTKTIAIPIDIKQSDRMTDKMCRKCKTVYRIV